jgi:hypothetical protein
MTPHWERVIILLDWIGWAATAVFASSYFFSAPAKLRLAQATAAVMWVAYGLMIGAKPVIVANLIVACAAGYTSLVGLKDKSSARTIP